MDRLPSQEEEIASAKNYCDTFYAVPCYVVEFITEINKELPEGYIVKPRTIARIVTLFFQGKPIQCLTYEAIEDNEHYAKSRLLGGVSIAVTVDGWTIISSNDIGQLNPLPKNDSTVLFLRGSTYYAGYYVGDSGEDNGFYCNVPAGTDYFISADEINKWRYV